MIEYYLPWAFWITFFYILVVLWKIQAALERNVTALQKIDVSLYLIAKILEDKEP